MANPPMSDEEAQEHFDNFFEDVFVELEDRYGEIEEMNVCDNLGDHLVGNVYVKFRREEDAERAVKDLNNRWFAGRPIYAELSPVTDFREACCRQYEMGECTRGGFCNFMHLKPISRELRRELYGRRKFASDRVRRPGSRERSRSRSKSKSRRHRSRSRSKSRSRRKSRSGSRSRRRSKSRERRSRSKDKERERRSRSKDKERERDRDHRRSKDKDRRRDPSMDKDADMPLIKEEPGEQNGV